MNLALEQENNQLKTSAQNLTRESETTKKRYQRLQEHTKQIDAQNEHFRQEIESSSVSLKQQINASHESEQSATTQKTIICALRARIVELENALSASNQSNKKYSCEIQAHQEAQKHLQTELKSTQVPYRQRC